VLTSTFGAAGTLSQMASNLPFDARSSPFRFLLHRESENVHRCDVSTTSYGAIVTIPNVIVAVARRCFITTAFHFALEYSTRKV
jgi:hypothetical protein